MVLIPSSVITELRSLENSNMPETFTLSVPGVPTRDAYGEIVEGAPVTSVVAGGVRPTRGDERVLGGAVVEIGDVVLRFPARTVVPANSTVTKAVRDGDVQRTYRVKAPLDGGSLETALEVLATEG